MQISKSLREGIDNRIGTGNISVNSATNNFFAFISLKVNLKLMEKTQSSNSPSAIYRKHYHYFYSDKAHLSWFRLNPSAV